MWYVDAAVFIFVLLELVFFHELGHFLAAKACGIYCERLSLGMPPRLFGFKFGETDYCIGLLPVGGYVKMAGQEDVPLGEEERKKQYGSVPPERWYMNKPVWQRMIVIGAGPFMNIVLAVLLYAIVASLGAMVPESEVENRIGRVKPDSAAGTAPLFRVDPATGQADFSKEPDDVGWRTCDRILSINGERITNINDVLIAAIMSAGKEVVVEIERVAPDGTVTRYLSPVSARHDGEEPYPIFGVSSYVSPIVGDVLSGTPAANAGIKKGDRVLLLDGQPVDAMRFGEIVEKFNGQDSIRLTIERDGQNLDIEVRPAVFGTLKDVVLTPQPQWLTLMLDSEPLVVIYDDPELLRLTGFRPKDVIRRIDGRPATAGLLKSIRERNENTLHEVVVERKTGPFGLGELSEVTLRGVSFDQLLQAITPFDIHGPPTILAVSEQLTSKSGLQRRDIIEEVEGVPATPAVLEEFLQKRAGQSLKLKVRKPAIFWGVKRQETVHEITLDVAAIGQVGVVWEPQYVFIRTPPARVLPEAFRLTKQAVKRTLGTLGLLLSGNVSPKELGGPILIYTVTTQAAEEGYWLLLKMTAFISVNLAIFNLLPLPVLDGGHLVFLVLEGVRRKPVPPKVAEWVQQVGLVLIIGLMLYVTFNDIGRWFQGFLP